MHNVLRVVRPHECVEFGSYGSKRLRVSGHAFHEFLDRADRRLHEQAKVLHAQRRKAHGASREERCVEAGRQALRDDRRVAPPTWRTASAPTPAHLTRRTATGVLNMAVGVKDAHISRWRLLRSANGSGSLIRGL